MNALHTTAPEGWAPPADKTSQTDDERIEDVMPLPPHSTRPTLRPA